MSDQTIKAAVNRFLAWPLPKDFGPDGGISFKECALWPTGTNLFHAGQAEAMFRHCLQTDETTAPGFDHVPGYESLSAVLVRAYEQAARGKGAARHAVSRPFDEQPMQSISNLIGTPAGLLYQAVKKIQESQRMDNDAAVRELLGAINYIAGYVINIESPQPADPRATPST